MIPHEHDSRDYLLPFAVMNIRQARLPRTARGRDKLELFLRRVQHLERRCFAALFVSAVGTEY